MGKPQSLMTNKLTARTISTSWKYRNDENKFTAAEIIIGKYIKRAAANMKC